MDLWDTILESEDTFVLEADDDKKDAKDSDTKTKKEDSKEPEKEESDTDDSGEDTPDEDDGGDEEPPSDEDMEEPPAEDGEDSDTSPEDGAEPDADGEGGDAAPDGEGTPDQDIGKNSKVNTIVLLDNFISLYKMIDNTIKKISESRKDNILASVTFNQVRANLSRLAGVVYKYITLYYDGNDHALNLYNFKYFMEILKLNLEMIRKVSSTNKETETSI